MFKEKEMLLPEKSSVESDKTGTEGKDVYKGEVVLRQYEEKIENGIWTPSIFAKYIEDGVLGVGAITKELNRLINREGAGIRITGDPARFDQKFSEESEEMTKAKLGAGRILIEFLKRVAPEVDVRNIEKTKLEHGDEITVVDSEYLKKDKKEKAKIAADGMITNLKDIPLMVLAADCAPVGIYDPENNAVGVFHSGWRGTLKQISPKGVQKMQEVYNSKPEQLIAAIGPYAKGEQFEVDEKVYKEFCNALSDGSYIYSPEEINTFFRKNEEKEGHYFLDTGQAIKLSLVKAGVLEKHIQISKYSTMDEKGNALFSSERIEGRQARDAFAFAMVLRNKPE